MPDYRLPPAMGGDADLLDALHEALVGADAFDGDPAVAGATRAHAAIVALQLVDALVGNGGFQLIQGSGRDLLPLAREAAELIGSPEHRALLDEGDDAAWYRLDAVLRRRLMDYVEAHPAEFFADTDETRATADRVRAKLAASNAWVAEAIAAVDRGIEAAELLNRHFGDRCVYLEEIDRLLLRPDDVPEAAAIAGDAGYRLESLAFFTAADSDAKAGEAAVGDDLAAILADGVARHHAAWVAAEFA